MKFKIFLLIILSQVIVSFDQDCVPELSTAYIEGFDLIAAGAVQESDSPSDGVYRIRLSKIYKCKVYRSDYILAKSPRRLTVNQEYLFYVNRIEDYFEVSECSRTQLLKKASTDVQYLEEKIKCIDESKITTGACHRNLDPVCGCDNKTYGNPCEAGRRGIQRYTFGRCKD